MLENEARQMEKWIKKYSKAYEVILDYCIKCKATKHDDCNRKGCRVSALKTDILSAIEELDRETSRIETLNDEVWGGLNEDKA